MKQAVAGLHAGIIRMPFERRPVPEPTLRAENGDLPRTWAASVDPAAERPGVPIKRPTIPPRPYTRTVFIGRRYARDEGLTNVWTEAVLRAFFHRDEDSGRSRSSGASPAKWGLARGPSRRRCRQPPARGATTTNGRWRCGSAFQAVPTALIGKRLVQGMRTEIRQANVNLLN